MKKILSFVCLLLVLPVYLQAQSEVNLLQKVSSEILNQKWEEAVATFRQAIGLDVDRADIYYRTEVDKNSVVAPRLAAELANYYKNIRNYDRAYSYYKELLERRPNDISLLSNFAESAFGRGKEKDAVGIYEKIVSIDPNNLRANIFLGSYYFMQAEQEKRQLDINFRRISSPTTMQKAHYRDGLKQLYSSDYSEAKGYLENVLKLFPSTEAKKMIETIAQRDKDVNG
jgi:tetratricopeptide (TPR) repeat protein